MINKIKAKRMFDKNNRDKHILHKNLHPEFDPNEAVISIDDKGNVTSATEDQLWRLCSSEDELELMGGQWPQFKADLIAEGTITEQDVNSHRLQTQAKLDEYKILVKNNPELLDKINIIRAAKGKGQYS